MFPIFWNEYLIYLNSCSRKGINAEKVNRFFVKFLKTSWMKENFYLFRYYMAAYINMLLLILTSNKKQTDIKPIFVFCGLRDQRLFRDGTIPTRVGLYNLRHLEYPHILQRLSLLEWLYALILACKTYLDFSENCRSSCRKHGVSWLAFQNLTLCGRLRHLDAILHLMAFEKYGGSVWFVEHFDIYVMILSLLRERGAIPQLCGCQHGFFEYPPNGRKYEAFFTDYYWLQYQQSKPWVERNLLKNKACQVKLDKRRTSLHLKEIERTPHTKVVAFASQEFLNWDSLIIDRLLAISRQIGDSLKVILYFHPNFPGILKPEWIRDGLIVQKERHSNIDLIITRFSTIGIDYYRIGVPVMFVPFGDRVCVFESGDFLVCEDLDQMEGYLRDILGYPSNQSLRT